MLLATNHNLKQNICFSKTDVFFVKSFKIQTNSKMRMMVNSDERSFPFKCVCIFKVSRTWLTWLNPLYPNNILCLYCNPILKKLWSLMWSALRGLTDARTYIQQMFFVLFFFYHFIVFLQQIIMLWSAKLHLNFFITFCLKIFHCTLKVFAFFSSDPE